MSGPRLPAPPRWSVYAAGILLWASGTMWLIAHYWLASAGEFGPRTSPIESWMLKTHGAAAMWTLYLVGLLWAIHITRGWRARRGRWTGGLLIGSLAVLAVTGWLLYYLGSEDWRDRVSVMHWVPGLATLPVFLWHRFARKKQVPARAAAERSTG